MIDAEKLTSIFVLYEEEAGGTKVKQAVCFDHRPGGDGDIQVLATMLRQSNAQLRRRNPNIPKYIYTVSWLSLGKGWRETGDFWNFSSSWANDSFKVSPAPHAPGNKR